MLPLNCCDFAINLFYLKRKLPLYYVTLLLRLDVCIFVLMFSATVSHVLLTWTAILAVFAELSPKSRDRKEWTVGKGS